MATPGYWKQQFGAAAPRVIASTLLDEENLNEMVKICMNEGPDWIGSQMRTGEKQYLGRVLVYHSDVMEKAYEIYQANPIFQLIDPPFYQMYPVNWKDERFQTWYREMDRTDHKVWPRMWNFYMAMEMEEMIGKHVVGTNWYKKNVGEIRKALNKSITVKTVMEDPMS